MNQLNHLSVQIPQKITKEIVGELKPQELELIWYIRNIYRFGSVEIVTREGLPVDIIKTIHRHRIG
jgi:hypothetical protein